MTRPRAEPNCLVLALAVLAVGAHAQELAPPAQGSGMRAQPRLSVTQSWTDNLQMSDQNKDAALVTMLSPGISLRSNGGALRGHLDYSLNGIFYEKSDRPSRVQNALTAAGQAELVSDRLFVDVRANIGQQNASAFGLQSTPTLDAQGTVTTQFNENQHETATLSVSPSWRGGLGEWATYQLGANFDRTETRGSSFGDSRGSGASLQLNQRNPGVLGWWARANSQRVRSSGMAANRNSALTLGLNYRPDVDWSFSANAGQERNNYLGNGDQNGATGGVSANWTPSPRTRAGANWQRHVYGNSHGLNLEHRFSRSVWQFADTRSTMLGNVGAGAGVRSNYDQFFLLFSSLEPDPVKRDVLVRAYLQAQGLSPDAPASAGFLSSGPSRVRTQLVSVALQGVRSSLTAQLSRTLTTRLGSGLNQGDLANSSRIELRSYSLTASHQLSPLSGLSLTALRQESQGDLVSQSTRLGSLSVNFNTRLAPRLSAQLGARHSRFEGVTQYTENAVYASLTQQF